MTADVIAIAKPKTGKTKKPVPQVATGVRMRRKLQQQRSGSFLVGAIALVLTALSLSHLAHGIVLVTGAETWESWAMAIGVDCSFVILELASMFTATEADRKEIKRYVEWAVGGTLLFSAAFNALAFSAQSAGWFIPFAALLGLAIPALIFACTRVCATLYLGYTARTN